MLSERFSQVSAMTATIEVTKIEEQAEGRLLFNVRAFTAEGRIDFPIGILDERFHRTAPIGGIPLEREGHHISTR